MSKTKNDIAVSNRYLYYYASLLKKIYGFIIRNQGENQPDERYVGAWDADPVLTPIPPNPPQTALATGSLPGTPAMDEIVFFRFRKRLLLGACQAILPRAVSEITVLAEDGRRLKFHHTNLVYLTGLSTHDVPLNAYATAVRELSKDIDLIDVWEIAAENNTPLSYTEISELFWYTDINAMQWIALYLHLNCACPYFHPHLSDRYTPYKKDQIEIRRLQLNNPQRHRRRARRIYPCHDKRRRIYRRANTYPTPTNLVRTISANMHYGAVNHAMPPKPKC